LYWWFINMLVLEVIFIYSGFIWAQAIFSIQCQQEQECFKVQAQNLNITRFILISTNNVVCIEHLALVYIIVHTYKYLQNIFIYFFNSQFFFKWPIPFAFCIFFGVVPFTFYMRIYIHEVSVLHLRASDLALQAEQLLWRASRFSIDSHVLPYEASRINQCSL